MNCQKIMQHRSACLAAWLFCATTLAFAQSWTVQTIPTRVADGKPVTVAFAILVAAQGQTDLPPVRHVLVYPQPLGSQQIKVASGDTTLLLGGTWINALPQLQKQGVTQTASQSAHARRAMCAMICKPSPSSSGSSSQVRNCIWLALEPLPRCLS